MEWTETLCRETGIRFLTTRPSEIEAASFAIIKEELGQEFLYTRSIFLLFHTARDR